MAWLKRVLTPPLIVVASLLMWIEDTLWHWLKKLTGWISLIPLVHKFEVVIAGLPPYAMMAVFLMPMTLLFPIKVLAVYWMTRGYWMASLTAIATAKIVGTAIVARMYVVCHDKLMTIVWFHRLHDWLIATRDQLFGYVRALPIYRLIRTRLLSLKLATRRFIERFGIRLRLDVRWRAFRRWYRHRNARSR